MSRGTISSAFGQCPKCNGYMYLPKKKNGRDAQVCKTCGFYHYVYPRWYERLMLWKY